MRGMGVIQGIESLSQREMEVYQQLIAFRTNREIAKELDLSEQTVKSHVSNILRKLDVASRRDPARNHFMAR